jgi:hypothetical protein
VIVNQELLLFFQQQLEEQVSQMEVSIYDRVLDQFFDGYGRLYIPNEITPETIYTLESLGRKIWCHRASGGIFISQEVKESLEQSAIEGLEFHLGFSWHG